MDRNQLTKTVSDRPGTFLIATAAMALFIVGLGAYVLTGSQRDGEVSRTGAACTNWTYESPVEKHLDGPDVQLSCERYFSSRSTVDVQRDDAAWQQKIKFANAKWDNRQQ